MVRVNYSATTRAIVVTVTPQYLPDQSEPAKSQYMWAYQVRIENRGDIAVQLRSRHWKITDGLGRQQEVRGPGVVGKTPVLRPGEVFEYTSGTPLSTPSGFMGGTYQMVNESGEAFDIEIPTFSLDTPSSQRRLN
ncbi:Co2+/Mg2+ efflux protein ApaG [Reyranella sp.]|uniref:Co2+/Mg2+ efflux protein ApaG n=1 Tax=Reyranella sp. TaxID=1929291 RepID=UPI0025DB4CAA|nr:Co2+/Mg2+ efflux protein ApaG [Reyranella sp.]